MGGVLLVGGDDVEVQIRDGWGERRRKGCCGVAIRWVCWDDRPWEHPIHRPAVGAVGDAWWGGGDVAAVAVVVGLEEGVWGGLLLLLFFGFCLLLLLL